MERDVPYIAYEATIARFERAMKRLTIALIICIVTIFASNMAWLWFFNSFEYTSDEIVTVDGKDGNANFVRNGGVINNGENSNRDETADAEEKGEG